MFIDQVTNADALPVLSATMRFAGQRHRFIAGNIANVSTPGYQPRDVSVEGFRSTLARAADRREARYGGMRGELELERTRQLVPGRDGSFRLRPEASGRNVLFHDRNNRDLERMMQDLAENVAAFRVSAELMRSRLQIMNAAISERP